MCYFTVLVKQIDKVTGYACYQPGDECYNVTSVAEQLMGQFNPCQTLADSSISGLYVITAATGLPFILQGLSSNVK